MFIYRSQNILWSEGEISTIPATSLYVSPQVDNEQGLAFFYFPVAFKGVCLIYSIEWIELLVDKQIWVEYDHQKSLYKDKADILKKIKIIKTQQQHLQKKPKK